MPTKNWKFLVEGNKVKILTTNLIDDSLEKDYPTVFDFSSSTENCRYYAFNYDRDNALFSYELPLAREEVGLAGKSCIYSITNEVDEFIKLIPGKAIEDLDQVCPDLQRGRSLKDYET